LPITHSAVRLVRLLRVAAIRLGDGMSPYPFWWCSLHPIPSNPERLRVLELIEIGVVDVVPLLGVVQRVGDVDPHAAMLLAEVVGQVWPRHEVEPGELHGVGPPWGEDSAFAIARRRLKQGRTMSATA
jgi:hypothetical protein